jgi:ABC-2 type transport system permease protein
MISVRGLTKRYGDERAALYLIFGEGPRDDMTVASARLILVAWAVAALAAGGWRLQRTDANR